MKNECNIIRDLLPLYAEDMVSPDTANFVEEHLKDCETCRKEYEQTKESRPASPIAKTSSTVPLVRLRCMLKMKKIQTIALTAIFMIALFVSAFAVLDAPIYLPYSEDLVIAEQLGDRGLLLTFDETVTDFHYTVYEDPNGGDFYYCDIEAWTSLWDQWFSQGTGRLSATVTTSHVWPVVASYLPNDGTESRCIAGYPTIENLVGKNEGSENKIVLPRLSLGYYFLFAAVSLIGMGIIRCAVRKKAEWCVWVERIGLYPIAYMISHGVVSGIGWVSYSLPRDLSLIIFLSILLYSGLLLVHNVWRLKREMEALQR